MVEGTIRIEWGRWFAYLNPRDFLDPPCWDGEIAIDEGTIADLQQLNYWGIFGPAHEERAPLPGPRWRSRIPYPILDGGVGIGYAGLEGVLFTVSAPPVARIRLRTRAATVEFSLEELVAKRKLLFLVDGRFSGLRIKVRWEDEDDIYVSKQELAAQAQANGLARFLIEAGEIGGAAFYRTMYRVDAAWIAPGAAASVSFDLLHPLQETAARRTGLCCMLQAMIGDPAAGERDHRYCRRLKLTVRLNGQEVGVAEKLFSSFRQFPTLEEVHFRLPSETCRAGRNRLELINEDAVFHLLVHRVYIMEQMEQDLQVQFCPKLAAEGEAFPIEILALRHHQVLQVKPCAGVTFLGSEPISLAPGEHRFFFRADLPVADGQIQFVGERGRRSVAVLEQVVPAELQTERKLKIGYDAGTVHPDSGGIEQLLAMLARKEWGNFILFRTEGKEIAASTWERWARFCRANEIYFMVCYEDFADFTGVPEMAIKIAEWGRSCFLGVQRHELSNVIYGWGGTEPPETRLRRTMETAKDAYVRRIRESFGMFPPHIPRNLGEAIPVQRFDYQAGIQICLSETMTSHTGLLLAAARGAARAYGAREWGLHIAVHVHCGPEDWENERMFWLNLYLGYFSGATIFYDEEAAFCRLSGIKQTFSDKLCVERRRHLQEFLRYCRTHPLSGKAAVRLGILQGNLDAITGGLDVGLEKTAVEQDLGLTVWGLLGPGRQEWAYAEPERGWLGLDVFMPGVWLAPLRQDLCRIRKWFNGTPYGQVDLVPSEADAKTLANYECLILLGWNTMTPDLYARLLEYVQQGGTLFLAVPHFTTRADRDFLPAMADLNLLYDGRLDELVGATIHGRGGSFTGTVSWASSPNPAVSSAVPSHRVPEARTPPCLAKLELSTATVVATDSENHAPVLLENRVGAGRVYLLATWNYPGHPGLDGLLAELLGRFGRQARGEIWVEDQHWEISYFIFADGENGARRICLLNTDWTEACNRKPCLLHLRDATVPLEVCEGRVTEVLWSGEIALVISDPKLHVRTVARSDGLYTAVLHGHGEALITAFSLRGAIAEVSCVNANVVREIGGEPKETRLRIRFGASSRAVLSMRVQPLDEPEADCRAASSVTGGPTSDDRKG